MQRLQIVGASCHLPVEELPDDSVQEGGCERRCQLDPGLAVTAFAANEARPDRGLARLRRIAPHKGSEFAVSQPDLRHVGSSREAISTLAEISINLFKIGHSNDKKQI
jgi:hypothetical protein